MAVHQFVKRWKDSLTIVLTIIAVSVSGVSFYRNSIYKKSSLQLTVLSSHYDLDVEGETGTAAVDVAITNSGTTDAILIGAFLYDNDIALDLTETQSVIPSLLVKPGEIKLFTSRFNQLPVAAKGSGINFIDIRLRVYSMDSFANRFDVNVPVGLWRANGDPHLMIPRSELPIELLRNGNLPPFPHAVK